MVKQLAKMNSAKIIMVARRDKEMLSIKKYCQEKGSKTEFEVLKLDMNEPDKCLKFA